MCDEVKKFYNSLGNQNTYDLYAGKDFIYNNYRMMVAAAAFSALLIPNSAVVADKNTIFLQEPRLNNRCLVCRELHESRGLGCEAKSDAGKVNKRRTFSSSSWL